MPRSIVYAPDAVRSLSDPSVEPAGDTAAEKLVKYVPAEVLAFFVPTYANLPADDGRWLWAVFAIGAVATVLYSLATRMREHGAPGPWYFYVLALCAFVGWSVGVTTVGADLLGVDPAVTPAILSITVLLVPLTDELLSRFWPAA